VKYLRGESYRLKLDELQKEVIALIGESVGKDLIQRHFEMMPDQELAGNSPGFISKQIQLVHQLGDKPIAVSCFKEIETHTQIGICTRDKRGTFRQITGVLASENANIMSAEIETRHDGLVIDAVNLTDESSRKSLSLEQRERITQALEGVWGGKVDFEAAIQKQEDANPQSRGRRNLSPRITIDNSGSSLATIIDIRAQDQVGLLYAISDTFYNLNLDIRIAKITTEGFTAMDSFYVTEQDGYKITNLLRLDEIKKSLIDRLSSAR
jgi:[protein-PII] uridylyltransferase